MIRFEIPELVTERLRLRMARLDDLDAYAGFLASERSSFVGGPVPRRDAFLFLSSIVGHWHLRGFGRWIVADRESDRPLGLVGLHHPVSWPEPEIGWTLFEGEGRCIAYEAALAAREHAYGSLGWTTVASLLAPDNRRSKALARRLGCTYESDFAHPVHGRLELWRHPGPNETATRPATAETTR